MPRATNTESQWVARCTYVWDKEYFFLTIVPFRAGPMSVLTDISNAGSGNPIPLISGTNTIDLVTIQDNTRKYCYVIFYSIANHLCLNLVTLHK